MTGTVRQLVSARRECQQPSRDAKERKRERERERDREEEKSRWFCRLKRNVINNNNCRYVFAQCGPPLRLPPSAQKDGSSFVLGTRSTWLPCASLRQRCDNEASLERRKDQPLFLSLYGRACRVKRSQERDRKSCIRFSVSGWISPSSVNFSWIEEWLRCKSQKLNFLESFGRSVWKWRITNILVM